MDRRQLKNVIIIILLLVNGFLAGSLAHRSTAARAARDRSAQQLAELFDADGIQLDPAGIPEEEPPAGRVLTRDPDLERSAAGHLLGGGLRRSERAGVCSYSGARGAALFRESGSFEAAGTLASQGGEEFCRKFCQDFHYTVSAVQLDDGGSGTITALREYGGLTVANCTVTFTLEGGAVTAARGTLLPDASAESAAGDQAPLSAQAALTAFLAMRRETGAVASSITGISLCYELQSSTATPMSLTPAWHIATDTVDYYVNCTTGTVSQY
nr:hypothetical protein [uncultured Oscillibacter sp.]